MISEPHMGDQDSSSSLPPSSTAITGVSTEPQIPATLKFIISNLKNIIPHHLTPENYPIWRMQLFQHLSANGYADHLTGKSTPPSDLDSPEYARWSLVDNNLISALFSTISPAILPYVIHSTTAQDVWNTLERRLQSQSRSRVIQLKNELHNIQMNNLTVQQYLSQIKNLVDNIAASGATIDSEDIVLYILKGLPPAYNSFKTYIRASPLPADLDNLYSLLCSEEIHINQDQHTKQARSSSASALYANSQSSNQNRYQKKFIKNKNSTYRQPDSQDPANSASNTSSSRPVCQICSKAGHIAINCWHRLNLKYAPTTTSNGPRALLAQPNGPSMQPWILDFGATTHLTSDSKNLLNSFPYNGQDSITVANGSSIPIHSSGQGLLPLSDNHRQSSTASWPSP
ncbi:Retrovirus-related Pol polyprotein from transposon TNT 1-94 [Dendrobium catenatum]|uniref:Retrovirus-related Pol polyprotein from transposon TNT 1-94 n=1 Tax=Dendrobium catenatum TaxID=906689 RepID=A0A2I0VU20_9ASPA|nr:Retrovirus-related Pol polyprotein from transposon TNT 1-94 [Dendrobium catenatum]